MSPGNEEDEFCLDESVLHLRGSLAVGVVVLEKCGLEAVPICCTGMRMSEGGIALNPRVDGGGLESREEFEEPALELAGLAVAPRSSEASDVLLERELGCSL